MGIAESAATVIGSTVSAVAGGIGGLFDADAPIRHAELTFDADADLPARTSLLRPGTRVDALARIAPLTDERAVRTVCIKLPDIYGAGRDQDFLLASSADGVPLHHATLPAARVGERLYSSLWLYVAGLQPVLFGARALGDDQFDFLIAGVLGRFKRVGALTLSGPSAAEVSFAGSNTGGGIRALPPVALYRAQR